MSTGKHTVIYSPSKSKVKDIFEYLGHYPDCSLILHHVLDEDDFPNIPDRPDLPLLLWQGGECFPSPTDSITRDFLYVTGNQLDKHSFRLYDISASKIWKNKLAWNTEKTKKFLFLNGKDIGHRRWIYTHLNQNNMLKDSIYSYLTLENMDPWFNNRLGFSEEDRAYSKLYELGIPHAPFDNTNLIRALPQSIYSDTYLSIVGESIFQHYPGERVSLMLTEKTYSACANLHMFVVAGPYGCIDLLHKQGFETFGDLWDESYDTEDQPKTRLVRICETLDYINKQDLSKLYEKCKERLLHNQNLIYTIDVKSRVDKITEWLTR